MALRSLTAPTDYPVSLAEAKLQVLDYDTVQDDAIEEWIVTATEHVADLTGRAIAVETFELVLDAFPAGAVVIPRPPLREILSVTYLDAAGALQTLTDAAYLVDDVSEPATVRPATAWPETKRVPNAVRIQFIAGYESAPARVKSAIKLVVADLFANREPQGGTGDTTVDRLINPLRVFA